MVNGAPLKVINDRPPLPAALVRAEVTPNCFIVRDADGQQLAYVYYESEPGRRSAAQRRRGAADCGEHCEATRVVAMTMDDQERDIGPYKRHELLTGQIYYPALGYSGYGDGKSTHIADFVTHEMRLHWLANRDRLLVFWKSGEPISKFFPDSKPWLLDRGDPR